jgi:hypothetical protein
MKAVFLHTSQKDKERGNRGGQYRCLVIGGGRGNGGGKIIKTYRDTLP